MGEKQSGSFQLCFNGFLKVDFQGSRVTSDGGLILIRECFESTCYHPLLLFNSKRQVGLKIRCRPSE